MNITDSSLPAHTSDTGGTPFDEIRRQDETGEWWSARDLQLMMDYENWRNFEAVISRAVRAAQNTSTYSDSAFVQVSELVAAGNLGMQERMDFHLNRHAAYLVAMNGDPSKPAVAAAQAYFAVQTRNAEIIQMPTHAVALRGWAAELEAREAAEKRAAELTAENKVLAPKAGKWDAFLNCEGLIGMTPLADILGIHVKGLTEYLVEIGLFRKQQSRFGSNHNMPRRAYQKSKHFEVKMETNGRATFEVAYATPLGADLVADLWAKRAAA